MNAIWKNIIFKQILKFDMNHHTEFYLLNTGGAGFGQK